MKNDTGSDGVDYFFMESNLWVTQSKIQKIIQTLSFFWESPRGLTVSGYEMQKRSLIVRITRADMKLLISVTRANWVDDL
jgi:hypothetical protein